MRVPFNDVLKWKKNTSFVFRIVLLIYKTIPQNFLRILHALNNHNIIFMNQTTQLKQTKAYKGQTKRKTKAIT